MAPGTTEISPSDDFLVTIPRNDILEAASSEAEKEESPLILLQLPTDTAPHQLQHFLADETRASLITDTASYSVQTLGTSNSLILLPPSAPAAVDGDTEADTPPAAKRSKPSRTARLLHKGNGASYLELRERSTVPPLGEWKALANEMGTKIVPAEWARRLHVASSQIVQWLTVSPPVLDVYENCSSTTSSKDPTFTILEPDDARISQEAILATLTECYGGTFATEGLECKIFLPEALERVAAAAKARVSADMMLHCAKQLCGDETNERADGTLRFELPKVAACVACQVLQRQDAWSPATFHEKVSLELPGSTTTFDDTWLRGNAVRNDDGDWVYLPANASHLTWEDLWGVGKSDWTREDLDPYLARLVLAAPDQPIDELLTQHMVKEETSETTIYRRK